MGKHERNGWFKLWRQSEDNELYRKGPFDEWHAWQDLILMAEYEGKDKGRLKTTYKALKIRWLWPSEKKVRAYLGRLEGRYMIEVQGTPGRYGGIRIFIKEYARFQGQKTYPKSRRKGQKNEQKGRLEGRQEENTSFSIEKKEVYEGSNTETLKGSDYFKKKIEAGEEFDPGEYLRALERERNERANL